MGYSKAELGDRWEEVEAKRKAKITAWANSPEGKKHMSEGGKKGMTTRKSLPHCGVSEEGRANQAKAARELAKDPRRLEWCRQGGYACKGKKLGPDNPMWKGGVTYNPYPDEFSNELKHEIHKMNDFKCVLCGSKDHLQVHHIDGDKLNTSLDNLTTLCRNCHTTYHHLKIH